mmetsp:Transcript_11040/g.24520  ORF Transcript_11040/g.24520 Transcript_11040/m.24520 type:complete len:753 (+) Transcript_11040:89-2347(+)
MAGSPQLGESSGFHSVLLSALARIELKVDCIDARIDKPRQSRQPVEDVPRNRGSRHSSCDSLRQQVEEPSTSSLSRQISPAAAAADIVSEARLSSSGLTVLNDGDPNWAILPNGDDSRLISTGSSVIASSFSKLEHIPCPRKPAEMMIDGDNGAQKQASLAPSRISLPQIQEKRQDAQHQQSSMRSNTSAQAEHIRRSFHSKTSNDRLTRSDSPGVTAAHVEARLSPKRLDPTDSERDEVPPLPDPEQPHWLRPVECGHQTSMKGLRVDSRKDTIDMLNKYTMSYGLSSAYGSTNKRRHGSPYLMSSKSALSNEGEFELLERIAQRARGKNRGKVMDGMWTFLTDPSSSYGAAMFFHIMNPVIAASTCLVIMEGADVFSSLFIGMAEAIINAFFLVEIILRFLTCPSRLAFARHPYNIIDIIALLPFLLRCAIGLTSEHVVDEQHSWLENLIAAFVLGGTPFLRLLKLLRRYERFHLILRCFEESLEALPVMFYMICLLSLLFSTLLYICEPRENILYVTDALWLTIVTMLTVGYGDTYPVSVGGKLVAVGLMFSGMLFMAIPIGIIGNTFNNVWERRVQLLVVLRTRERLKQWGYQPSDIPNFFELADRRKLGYLTYKQFRSLLNAMHVKMSDHAFRMLFEVFDQDGNGQVDHWEFLRVVFPEYYYDVCGPGIEDEVKNETAPSLGVTLMATRRKSSDALPSGTSQRSVQRHSDSGSSPIKYADDMGDRSYSSSMPSECLNNASGKFSEAS